jgi:MoaA/NifB/PqqE/SkfB family radical SAM enzyme
MATDLTILNSHFSQDDGGSTQERLTSLPILLLHIHESCNCRCQMCDIWRRKDGKELDVADFARHRDSLLRFGVRHVVLTGGEPLLHRDLPGLCRLLREGGVQIITLLSTGLLLERRSQVIADWIDEVIVSLDGPQEVHDQVRRVQGAFRIMSEGIRVVRQRKPTLQIHGRSTIQKANHRLLRQTVSAAKALNLDSISFLAVDLTSQAFNRDLIWPGERQDEIALSRAEVEGLEEEMDLLIAECADEIRSRFVVESETKLRRIARRFREHLGDAWPVAPMCNAPWVSAVMEVDGSVRPCFFHDRVGNTRNATLEQVINGAEARRFRGSLDVSENAICQRCVCSLHYEPNAAPCNDEFRPSANAVAVISSS